MPAPIPQPHEPYHVPGGPKRYTTLILDLGDVLFTWSAGTKLSVAPKTIKAMMCTTDWHDYERSRICQAECYRRLGDQFAVDPLDVDETFRSARETLTPNTVIFELVRKLKAQFGLTVFAMSNISVADFEVLRTKDADWDVFDHIFTSGDAGMRKPDLSFFDHVVRCGSVDPYRAIFVDDKLDNVLAARSIGMCGVVFQSTEQVAQALQNLICDPISRAWEYLRSSALRHESFTNTGEAISETFAQLLILELTGDRSLVKVDSSPRLFNFFVGKGQLTTENFPCDLDTTSVAWTVVKRSDDPAANSVMDEMLRHCNSDGIVQVYFDHTRPRVDPVACLNVLTLFHTHGRGSELQATLDWVYAVLLHRAYLDGTRYYAAPEAFLYFFARLLSVADDSPHSPHIGLYAATLAERLCERVGSPGDALALAMRVSACASVGIADAVDLQRLLARQAVDGGWEDGWFYKYSNGVAIGNKGLTTAFALRAIEAARALRDAARCDVYGRDACHPTVDLS